MVTFITGRSGSGKTWAVHEVLRHTKEYRRTLLIVPEQSSFQNEKMLLSEMGAKGAKHIEVLSFRRLCSVVFEEYSNVFGERIDNGAKAVLMSMAIDAAPREHGEDGILGGSQRRKTALIEPMLTAVNEYKMCMISPERLYDAAKNVHDKVLSSKLRDSAGIYAAYNALLENTYADPDDDLVRLYEVLSEKDYFRDSCICIDSFSGFSAQEMKIIECIFRQAKDVFVTLCGDREEFYDDESIFSEAGQTYRHLMRLAQKYGHVCEISDKTQNGRRFRAESLKALEAGIFPGYRSSFDVAPVEDDGAITLYSAADIYDEVRFVARSIWHLVHDDGLDYSEIEVISRQPELYRSAVTSEFPKYEIPYYLSAAEDITGKPVIRFFLSALETIISGFDTEAVLRYAKTGLTALSYEEICELEDYAYVHSITGRRWIREFCGDNVISAGKSETDDASDAEISDDFEDEPENSKKRKRDIPETGKILIEPLCELERGLKEAQNGGDICRLLYSLSQQTNARKHFRGTIKRLSLASDEQTAQREASVWDIAMHILNNMYELLKNTPCDTKRFFELFRLYMRKTQLSDIPRTINSVVIGTAGTIRSDNPRVVFVIGAVQGVFPAVPSAVGIFTDRERRFLRDEREEDQRLPLYDSVYGNSLKEKNHAYMALTAASEKLYVSWYTQSLSGSPGEPSVIYDEILNIVPQISCAGNEPEEISADNAPERLCTERQSFDICAGMWNTDSVVSQTLKEYYLQSEKYSSRTKAVSRGASRKPFALHDLELIRELYGTPLRLSSTRLDTFTKCKFSYFCKYALKAYPLKKAEMDSQLFGTAAHYLFEKLLGGTAPEGCFRGVEGLLGSDEKEIRKSVGICLDDYINSLGDEVEKNGRFSALCEKLSSNAVRVLMRMKEQYSVDKFRPVDFELVIGGEDAQIPACEIKLPTGDSILLTGIVDRVDTAVIDGKRYIRIIDYKTGEMKFSFNSLAQGFNIQMLLYLSSILRNGSERYDDGHVLLPAGVLYVPSAAGGGESPSSSPEGVKEAVKQQNKDLKMNGLLLDDVNVMKAMNENLDGEFIPLVLTAQNSFRKNSGCVVSAEEFGKIFSYVDICLKYAGMEMLSGAIEAYPSSGACKFCDYSSVCRFEKGSRTRKVPPLGKEGTMKKIDEEIRKETESDGQ